MRAFRTLALLALPSFVAAPTALGGPPGPGAPGDVPAEVRALEGTYTGSWTMYGVDAAGQVVKRMAWTDTIRADRAAVEGGRAYVAWTAEQRFEGAQGPPRKVEGKEGYLLTNDGALGDYFMEMFGQITRMTRLADNVWSYAAPARAQELSTLGFPEGASGQHVQVKVVTKAGDVETHHISRLSTVTWTDKDGKPRSLQFLSLHGQHQRQR